MLTFDSWRNQTQTKLFIKNSKNPGKLRLMITVIIPTRNEEKNIKKCLENLDFAERVIVIDSNSRDETANIATKMGAEVVQFPLSGGYPKKRQWAMDNLGIKTPWTLLLDSDEEVSTLLKSEIIDCVRADDSADAYLLRKDFHFLGKRLRFGGFSFQAVSLFRTGQARFERITNDISSGLDMEVHERLIVRGSLKRLRNSLIHRDFKDITSYIEKHNRYASWEADVRYNTEMLVNGNQEILKANLFGDVQQRRRFLKVVVMKIPLEPLLWFIYHYVIMLGFLEGRRGLYASLFRACYIAQVRAKIYEKKLG